MEENSTIQPEIPAITPPQKHSYTSFFMLLIALCIGIIAFPLYQKYQHYLPSTPAGESERKVEIATKELLSASTDDDTLAYLNSARLEKDPARSYAHYVSAYKSISEEYTKTGDQKYLAATDALKKHMQTLSNYQKSDTPAPQTPDIRLVKAVAINVRTGKETLLSLVGDSFAEFTFQEDNLPHGVMIKLYYSNGKIEDTYLSFLPKK